MIKRPFFGMFRPSLKYPVADIGGADALKQMPLPPKTTLFLRHPDAGSVDFAVRIGDTVKTGQRIQLVKGSEKTFISPVTGAISDISPHTGYLGQAYASVSIDTADEDQWDDEFSSSDKIPTRENALKFFRSFPGASDFASLMDFRHPVNTIVVMGVDIDLLISTNQFIVKNGYENLSEGVKYLKEITHTNRIVLIVTPGSITRPADETGVEIKEIIPCYPNTLPKLIMRKILGKVMVAGKSCEEMGIGFLSAEAVVSLAKAFSNGEMPVDKALTVIDKNNRLLKVRARIGTPIKDILNALHVETSYGDRLVLGGPMTGRAVHSEDTPVMYDTDAIMVQAKDRIVHASDCQCINCGECVRACPAKIPVNMLVRLLENGLYEEAAEQYDLLSCIECGLCSYVCVARIPVFHYIMLGKYEFARTEGMEESNA
jgi:electron transport complex protein RnfC